MNDLDRTPIRRCPDAIFQFIRYLAHCRVSADPISFDNLARAIRLALLEHLWALFPAGTAENALLSIDLYFHLTDLLCRKETALEAARTLRSRLPVRRAEATVGRTALVGGQTLNQ
jgi:hypothetical protein